MSLDEYLSRLDPKTAQRVKTAQEIELVKYPLASVGLTQALNGGIGAGRVSLVYGNTSSGKSVLLQQSIGKLWQPAGLVCAWVDAEGTYEKSWGARLGINNDDLILIQSKSSGRIEKEIRPHIEAGIDIIVIDSVSDILPEVFIEKDGSMAEERKQVGAHAKAITNLINGIHYLNEKTAVILISQTTTEFGQTYVKQVPHGGKKILFASSQVIKLSSSNTENAQIKGEVQVGDLLVEAPVGRKVEYYVEKNKMGRQSTKGAYDLYYAGKFVGIDATGEMVDLAEDFGVISKTSARSAWYNIEGKSIQGRDNVIKLLDTDSAVRASIESQVNLFLTGGEISE